MAALNFDARTVAPDTGSADALPAGWYNVMMDESEMKPTKADASGNAGAYLKCRYTVLDGQYAGRKIFANLNLRNSNPVAQEIAYKQLSAICHAVGVMNMTDSQELHGKPLKVKVKVRKATDEYEASNDIGAYKNINDTSVGAAATGGAPAGAPAGFGMAPAAGAPAGFGGPAPGGFPPAQQQMQPQYQQPPQQQFAPQAAPQPAQAPQWQQPQSAPQPWQQPQGMAPQQAPVQQQYMDPAQQQQMQQQQFAQAPAQAPQQFAPQQQPQQFAPAPAPAGAPIPPWQQPQ